MKLVNLAFKTVKQCIVTFKAQFPRVFMGSCHKRQKPQAPIRNRQTRKVANAKGLNRKTNLTLPNLTELSLT